ncbi:MAG: polysaccharide biosynthesis protein, partial [Phascolarctobacterium sp.]
VYSMIIRYGGVHVYMRLFATDLIAILFYFPLKFGLGLQHMTSQRWLIIILLNLLGAVGIRLMYRYCYRFGVRRSKKGEFLRWLLIVFAGDNVVKERRNENKRIRVAILGAGRLGAVLADELLSNDNAPYVPVCFIDQDKNKAGREVMGLPVLPEGEESMDDLKDMGVQEVVFAITNIINTKKDSLFKMYKAAGYKVKVYDFSVTDVAKSGKRVLREFDIEELLFRQPIVVNNELVSSYYKDKVILVTGGGGSIGSEMCRQVAKMEPKQIIALDIYENGVYDLQQELHLRYGADLNFKVEIANICSKSSMTRIMEEYHPDIVIHAAAHKHVPLMEKNCIEAVENNVFGTLNVIELCEQYKVGRFMMVSTDKAVNPTNIMGATKRMCEIIARAHSAVSKTTVFSDTRFGNVLGSAGSVIPLFKRQIANGGPITITDKRIIRYFMTIPEASQLVLHSGAIAKNGELFVLDMGQPIKIYDLAVNMIKLSGLEPFRDIDIIETGLRPGEKLYEELLVKSETLQTTDNKLVFIEKDEPIGMEDLQQRLAMLRTAIYSNDDERVREVMHEVVPTFRTPEEVNCRADASKEMKSAKIIE